MPDRKLNLPVVVALIVVLIISGVGAWYYHNNVYLPKMAEINKKIQTTQPEKTSVKTGERTLVGQTSDGKIKIYVDGDYVILDQDGLETEFTDWDTHMKERDVNVYYTDFDGDDAKEIIFTAYEKTDEKTGEDLYGFYMLRPSYAEDNTYEYKVYYTNHEGWSSVYTSLLKSQMNQLTSTPKRLQFAMGYTNSTINYDKESGIAVGHERVYYMLSQTDINGEILTMTRWEKGPCVISISPETYDVTVTMNIYVYYDGMKEPQNPGQIVCGLSLYNDEFTISKKSVSFQTYDEFFATNPATDKDVKAWEVTIKDFETGSDSKVIKDLAYSCSYNYNTLKTAKSTVKEGYSCQGAGIDKIVANQTSMKIYAKSGYSFDSSLTQYQNVRLYIHWSGKIYNITNSATISTVGNQQVLTISFDKPYTIGNLYRFDIVLGNKGK